MKNEPTETAEIHSIAGERVERPEPEPEAPAFFVQGRITFTPMASIMLLVGAIAVAAWVAYGARALATKLKVSAGGD